MKSTTRVFAAGAVIVLMLFGVSNAAFAEKSPASRALRGMIPPLFAQDMERTRAEAQPFEVTETRQPAEHAAGAGESETPGAAGALETSINPDAADNRAAASELRGTVTALDGATITVDGTVLSLAQNAEGLASVRVGDAVKLELVINADGSLAVREVKLSSSNASRDTSQQPGDDSSSHGGTSDDSSSGSASHDSGGPDEDPGG